MVRFLILSNEGQAGLCCPVCDRADKVAIVPPRDKAETQLHCLCTRCGTEGKLVSNGRIRAS